LAALKENPVDYSEHRIAYSVSIGITLHDSSNNTPLEQLFKQADHALYQAKNSGKARVVVYADN
jgi:FOG: GGDEF domain